MVNGLSQSPVLFKQANEVIFEIWQDHTLTVWLIIAADAVDVLFSAYFYSTPSALR